MTPRSGSRRSARRRTARRGRFSNTGELDELDLVTQDMLIGQVAELEKFQWFIRAHLESAGSELATGGAHTERQAAAQA